MFIHDWRMCPAWMCPDGDQWRFCRCVLQLEKYTHNSAHMRKGADSVFNVAFIHVSIDYLLMRATFHNSLCNSFFRTEAYGRGVLKKRDH